MGKVVAAALCIVCIACLGCGSGGPDLGEVTGVVTIDGTPASNVMVTFTPVGEGRPSTGKTDEAGKYVLGYGEHLGAVVGKHKVSVMSLSGGSSGISSEIRSDDPAYAQQATGGSEADYNSATVKENIPAEYNTATTLEFEVQSGSNTYNIDVKTK